MLLVRLQAPAPWALRSFNSLLSSEYILSPWQQQFRSIALLPEFINQQLWETIRSLSKESRKYKEKTKLMKTTMSFAYSGWTCLSLFLSLQVVLRVLHKQKQSLTGSFPKQTHVLAYTARCSQVVQQKSSRKTPGLVGRSGTPLSSRQLPQCPFPTAQHTGRPRGFLAENNSTNSQEAVLLGTAIAGTASPCVHLDMAALNHVPLTDWTEFTVYVLQCS